MLISSAILFNSFEELEYPIILSGLRHADIYEKAYTMRIPFKKSSVVEGFLTDDNKFLNRYDARLYALSNDQLILDENSLESNCLELYSEDIWPE